MVGILVYNMKEFFTDKLDEKVYHGNYLNLKTCEQELTLFFEELIKRKRNDPIDGGLQASTVIFEDRFGAKVNELDGGGLHIISEVDLTKFLFNDSQYLTEKASEHFGLYMSEIMKLSAEAITIRILDGIDELMIAITSENKLKSKFEVEMLKIIIKICDNIKKNNYYKSIKLGINLPNISMDFSDYDKKRYKWYLDNLKLDHIKRGLG